MTNITKLRGLLAEATPGNQLVLVHYMPALLDRLDKLEAVAEAASELLITSKKLDEALATLDSKLGETE
jgi:hypothetical protein